MEQLTAEPAQEKDAPLVAQILTEATKYKLKHNDRSWNEGAWTEEEVKGTMASGQVYLGHQEDTAVGTFALDWADEQKWGDRPAEAGYLHRLALKDDLHGQGLGARMVDLASAEVAKTGRAYLRLDCAANNTDLCDYYEELGFTRVGDVQLPEYETPTALFERPV